MFLMDFFNQARLLKAYKQLVDDQNATIDLQDVLIAMLRAQLLAAEAKAAEAAAKPAKKAAK